MYLTADGISCLGKIVCNMYCIHVILIIRSDVADVPTHAYLLHVAE